MFSAIATLALAGVAASSPIDSIAYPPQALQDGFNLVVNVTDRSTDFKDTPIHGTRLIGRHNGAGLAAPTFYNSTENKADFFKTNDGAVMEAILGSAPAWISLDGPPSDHLYNLDVGVIYNTAGITTSMSPADPLYPCSVLFHPFDGTYVACDNGVETYQHPKLELKYLEGADSVVPSNCIAINLLPECAPINIDDVKYDHKPIEQTLCYTQSVSSIDWSQYQCWAHYS